MPFLEQFACPDFLPWQYNGHLQSFALFFHFETPEHGGHCGFQSKNNSEFHWSEQQTLEFVSSFRH